LRLLDARPRILSKALKAAAESYDFSPTPTPQDLLNSIAAQGPGAPLRASFHTLLARWDYVGEADWAEGTPPSTRPRRDLIYRLLDLSSDDRIKCDQLFPYTPALDAVTIIADPSHWQPWYSDGRKWERAFYWTAYRDYLAKRKGWSPKNIALLDESSTNVVERLADPEDADSPARKGLVVGYVQSGKTANFTAVIAKAADAGYRLVVVLAGLQNTLRDQTQRRLDKELLGQELVRDEYRDALDWAEFISHGGLPSHQGAYDWERLTTGKEDFRQLRVGLSALAFRLADPGKPFRNPVNLHVESARLIVVKKNPTALSHLLQALEQAARHVMWPQVPALVIDDESDQASINTKRPRKELQERTRINELIVGLLRVLKRAQYVGYTATPFANVFINPDEAEDLFPSDFLLSLPRPDGYMGVGDFYDDKQPVKGDYHFNKNAFVRSVVGEDTKAENLVRAIDSFVLSGMIKLFRQSTGQGNFRHHTMLVHNSPSTEVHKTQAKMVREIFSEANYAGGGPGVRRLEDLWQKDYSPVSRIRAAENTIHPASFSQLKQLLGECFRRVTQDGDPVIVLNGKDREQAPDFDAQEVWKIIVGGAKLSRGYTVEGLTVSYYRRRAQAADTLMQMGRWFGYRGGYRDLVRLFIGTKESFTDKDTAETIDLYDAFQGVCLDEEEFRQQLHRYASLKEGERITPKQIPPLVPSHMLQPSARNKMYNAELTFLNFGGSEVQRTSAPTEPGARKANAEAMQWLLSRGSTIREVRIRLGSSGKPIDFEAKCTELRSPDVLAFLKDYKWKPTDADVERKDKWSLVLEFLRKTHGDPDIDQWLLLSPKRADEPAGTWKADGTTFSVRRRSRTPDGKRYLVYSEPMHVTAAKYFASIEDGRPLNSETRQLRKPKQGVFLFYPVVSPTEEKNKMIATMGFVLLLPPNSIRRKIAYSVVDQARQSAVVVDVPGA
jgi:hypothetical protein